MARINIEDDVETRQEFWNLLPLVDNNRDTALGKLVRFFRLAQDAYGRKAPVTLEELRAHALEVMITSGWAVEIPGGYQAKGADTHFAWYRQKLKAGKRGGRPRKKPKCDSGNRPVISGFRNSTPVSENNPPAPAPAPAPVSKKHLADPSDGTRLWEFYSEGIKAKNLQAVKSGKTGKFCRDLVRKHGLDRAKDIVQTFLADTSPFVADQAWQLGLLISQEQRYLARASPPPPPKRLGTLEDLQRLTREYNGEASDVA